jgi:hypothetical protein
MKVKAAIQHYHAAAVLDQIDRHFSSAGMRTFSADGAPQLAGTGPS